MATVQCYIVAWDAFLNQIPILSTPLLPYTYSYSHSHSYSPTLYFVLCTLHFVLRRGGENDALGWFSGLS